MHSQLIHLAVQQRQADLMKAAEHERLIAQIPPRGSRRRSATALSRFAGEIMSVLAQSTPRTVRRTLEP